MYDFYKKLRISVHVERMGHKNTIFIASSCPFCLNLQDALGKSKKAKKQARSANCKFCTDCILLLTNLLKKSFILRVTIYRET